MSGHDIVVIGGSTGSGTVLKQIVRDLPADLRAAICVSTHVSADRPGYLVDMLGPSSTLPINYALDGQPIESGRIYVAPPNRHLLLVDHSFRLGHGPRENSSRPAIDAMFRSAALTFGPRVVGVVLTGYLNDGASGLFAIQQAGGLTVVQHPLDAQAEAMPRAALEAVAVDHVARADEIGGLISNLVQLPAGSPKPPPPHLALDVEIALGGRLGSDRLREMSEPAALSCPHCHGVLSKIHDDGPLRFRCQIGHAFTAEAALVAQEGQVEEAVRLAMRLMEERVELVRQMARNARAHGRTSLAELFEARMEEYGRYAETLRQATTVSMKSAAGSEEGEA